MFIFILPFLAIPFLPTVTCTNRDVSIHVDTTQSLGDLPQITRFFGCDEPNYAYYPDSKHLLSELGQLGPHQTFFRTHNLLTTCDPPDNTTARLKWGCTNAYTEDAHGNAIYNWTIVDHIFDTYLQNKVKPYAQIGFMPKALARNPEPYTFNFTGGASADNIFTGWTHPPTDWQKWHQLVYEWVKHCVERYGLHEVENWYWEVWNEPNIPYWNGTREEYYQLYDHAVTAVKAAAPGARVGGAEVAGGAAGDYLGEFIKHTQNRRNAATGKAGSNLDFISFHAKGSPTYINATANTPGHLQMNLSAALNNVKDGFSVIASYPSTAKKPVVIGEDDPDSCAACQSPSVDYRNGLIYPSYTAASFSRQMDLALKYGVNFQGALTWAFEYDDHAYFDGYRVLSTNQIAKPILNVFRMFGKLDGKRVKAESTGQIGLQEAIEGSIRGQPDVGILAAYDEGEERIGALVWHYHDDALPKPDATVELSVALPETRTWFTGWWRSHRGREDVEISHYRIDERHSNSYSTWLAMGSPQQPTREQYRKLQESGKLAMLEPQRKVKASRSVGLEFELPIHAVSLIMLDLKTR